MENNEPTKIYWVQNAEELDLPLDPSVDSFETIGEAQAECKKRNALFGVEDYFVVTKEI